MAGWQSPSPSYSRHSSYSVNGDSIYPPGYTFSHPSPELSRPPANRGARYRRGGNWDPEGDADIQSVAQSAESIELSYLGSESNAEFDRARPTESVGSYHSREQMQNSYDPHGQDHLQAESHYSNAPVHASPPAEPILPHEEYDPDFDPNYDPDYNPTWNCYTLGFRGDEREGRRQGLRFLKDYYPPAGCPDGVHCPECASHSGAVCDGGAEFRLNDM
jgi:hypothetical protein